MSTLILTTRSLEMAASVKPQRCRASTMGHMYLSRSTVRARGDAGEGKVEAVVVADDVSDEVDGGDEVLVEAAREEVGHSGEPMEVEAKGGEKVELGAEDPFGIEGKGLQGVLLACS
jgi:hypothetical protein